MGVVFSLEGMANIYAREENYERAACLIGWADKARARIPDTRPLLEQGDVDQVIAAITAKIGNTAFEEGYASGQEMTLEDAVMLALKEN